MNDKRTPYCMTCIDLAYSDSRCVHAACDLCFSYIDVNNRHPIRGAYVDKGGVVFQRHAYCQKFFMGTDGIPKVHLTPRQAASHMLRAEEILHRQEQERESRTQRQSENQD